MVRDILVIKFLVSMFLSYAFKLVRIYGQSCQFWLFFWWAIFYYEKQKTDNLLGEGGSDYINM